MNDRGQLTGIIGIKQVANYNWREKRRETVGRSRGQQPGEIKVSSIALNSVFTIARPPLGGGGGRVQEPHLDAPVDDGDLVGY